MTHPYDVDVAIIGYGPSGVAAANTLGARGVSFTAFERDRDIYPRARAVTVNDWTMRIFQSFGADEAVKRDMDVMRALRWITYAGEELYRVDFPPSTLGGNARFYTIYQPLMEATLREHAERHTGGSVRYGTEVVGVEQDADGVTVTARDLTTGRTTTTRARYALACDGGSSPTRELLGVQLDGDTLDVTWVVIDTYVKRWWPDRNLLTFWSDRDRPVVDIALARGHHRWEIPLRPEESRADFAAPGQIWPLLKAMGVSEDDVEIHQHAFYKHHLRTADRWRVGRVFLVGDAAHLMPPWAGSGMQSGIRDAFDISWKLTYVLDGRMPDAFLDTYETERRPNVALYTSLSDQLGKIVRLELSEEEMSELTAPPVAGEPAAEPPLIRR
ncbi:FAD-dependent monooxygenase [Actinocorallia libanotica]|uniref:FAD-binding domain-containing protein n=1 Tax=Actinocorallia libanotica TaxID=46162 RepID=A0ABN1QIA6_9ACTN